MKKLWIIALAALVTFGFTAVHQDHYTVDVENSKVKWTGEKISESHFGEIKLKEGTFSMDHGKLAAAHFIMDMDKIRCTDIESDEWNRKLVGHLKNEDFFDVKNHPTAEFRMIKANRMDEKTFEVLGSLTIKGITKAVTFPVTLAEKANFYIATGVMTFDRTKYGIKYGSGSFFEDLGDRMIKDEVTLEFSIVGENKNSGERH